MSIAAAPDRAATLASLLGRLDSWMGAAGYDVEHPWRLSIAEGLAVGGSLPATTRGPTSPPQDDPTLAAVAAIGEQLGFSLLRLTDMLHDCGVEDSSVLLACDALERAGWLAERIALLAGGRTAAIKGSADGWFLSPLARQLVKQAGKAP